MTTEKKKKIILITAIVLVGLIIIGATYAYFQAQLDSGKKADVTTTSDTTDQLRFNVDNNINLSINQFNFGPGQELSPSVSKATAILRANSTENTATYHYYVYFNIEDNKFIYTTEDHKTEILLQITNPDGQAITSVAGLNYDETLQGFDITTASGLFTIADNYAITSNSSTEDTTQEWTFTAKFINLNSDQEANTGKSMNGKIVIQRVSSNGTLADSCKSGDNLASCIINYTTNNVFQTQIYHHNENLENGANDGSYRYSGANPNNYVCFGYDDETHNYASGWCPNDNLYRIIGIFEDNVKLIKADYATADLFGEDGDFDKKWDDMNLYATEWWSLDTLEQTNYRGKNTKAATYYWSKIADNVWSSSELNKTNLNSNYLKNIGNKWSIMIDDTIWYVGGISGSELNAKETYDYELGENKGPITTGYEPYESKIGLMYVSEYYYAASPEKWILSRNNYNNAIDDNWLYLGDYEATITNNINSVNEIFYIDRDGTVYYVSSSEPNLVRPTFNLIPFITYIGGRGSESDPIRIGSGNA